MNKHLKKAIKLATITSIAASAVIAVNPTLSEAASTAETLVLKAEANKVPLIRAISVDYYADAVKQPWTEYNKAKKDYAAAKSAVNKLSGKQKEVLNARLDIVKLWIDRTAVYIDSITSGKKLIVAQEAMEKYLTEGKMAEATKAYHALSYEIKKQAAFLYRVYGQSTRQAILETYKLPAETAKNDAIYPVSIHIELGRLEAAIDNGNDAKMEQHMANIEDWFQYIEDPELFEVLGSRYDQVLSLYFPVIEEVAVYEGSLIPTEFPWLNAFDLFGFYDADGYEVYPDPTEYGFIVKDDKGFFNEDGSFTSAYEENGLTETGTVNIQLIDSTTNEVIIEHTFDIVDGNQIYYLEDGKLVDAQGADAEALTLGQTYQFVPTEAGTLNGWYVVGDLGQDISLADFEGITFDSLDPSVFTVDANGVVTPVAAGESELVVTWNDFETWITVIVE
ncbi:hypothetical protein ACFYKX_14390 [Cytobacillus sp. FJAT-54145]|uniref:SbsC C-terminal domain-containing protein n=1 Tax=Cytobacillus spartinae TaxID=3299023 RepID=A0ABW6KC21_9BACI